jgi:hypothetical protein
VAGKKLVQTIYETSLRQAVVTSFNWNIHCEDSAGKNLHGQRRTSHVWADACTSKWTQHLENTFCLFLCLKLLWTVSSALFFNISPTAALYGIFIDIQTKMF